MKPTKAILIAFIAITMIAYSSAEIRFVFNLISSGHTSPPKDHLNTINEDAFGERWDQPDQLTPIGMRMQYLLGRRNFVKYGSLLSNTFNPLEFKIMSTSKNSTLSSVQAHLQGIYPPGTGPSLSGYQRNVAYPPQGKTGYGSFNQETFGAPALPENTQVFPYTTYSANDWNYFFMYDIKNDCEDLYLRIIDNERTEDTKNMLSNFKSLYGTQLANAIGLENTDAFDDYNYVKILLSDFVADYYEGKLLKRLTDAGINLANLNNTAINFLNNDMYKIYNDDTDEDGKLYNATWAAFARELIDYMDHRMSLDRQGFNYTKTDAPLIYLSSVEPLVIASMLKYLNVHLNTNIYYVPYASSLNFELTRPDGKNNTILGQYEYYVTITYNDIDVKTIVYHELRKYLSDAWDHDDARWKCGLTPFKYWGFQNASIVLGILLGIVFILFIIYLIKWLCSLGRNEKVDHNEIDLKGLKDE